MFLNRGPGVAGAEDRDSKRGVQREKGTPRKSSKLKGKTASTEGGRKVKAGISCALMCFRETATQILLLGRGQGGVGNLWLRSRIMAYVN